MGKKDMRSREYTRQNEIFADLCNYKIYGGREVIKPTDLHEKDATELVMPYGGKTASIPIQKFRDVLKIADVKETDTTTYVIIGVENQSEIHYAMAVRNMLYDAIDYASQVTGIAKINRECKKKKTPAEFLSGLMKNDKIKPVITIVVYWGSDEWDGARTLHEMLDADDEVLEYVPNYFLNLIVPSEIKDFDKFSTNLGLVLQCVKCSSDKEAFKEMLENKKNEFSRMPRNAAELISELVNIKLEIENQGGEDVNMCKALEDIMAENREIGEKHGEARGKELGEKRGKQLDRIGLIRTNKDELSVSAIASFMKVDEDYVNRIIYLIEEFPDEDDSKLAERIIGSV